MKEEYPMKKYMIMRAAYLMGDFEAISRPRMFTK
jgi:hypothetical protein